jgi:hypothetical protein
MSRPAPPVHAATVNAAAMARTRDRRRFGLGRDVLVAAKSASLGAAQILVSGNADIVDLHVGESAAPSIDRLPASADLVPLTLVRAGQLQG